MLSCFNGIFAFLFWSLLAPTSRKNFGNIIRVPNSMVPIVSAQTIPSFPNKLKKNHSDATMRALLVSTSETIDSVLAPSELLPKSDFRCGIDEEDARTACGKVCVYNSDCDSENDEFCWSTMPNKCYIDEPTLAPQPTNNPAALSPTPETLAPSPTSPTFPLITDFRCGTDEKNSRTNCGRPCVFNSDCNTGEYCWSTFPNDCYINDATEPPTKKSDSENTDRSCVVPTNDQLNHPSTACISSNECSIGACRIIQNFLVCDEGDNLVDWPEVCDEILIDEMIPTTVPTDQTLAPSILTSAPISSYPTSKPINPTLEPTSLTFAPVEPTPTPFNPTFAPIEPTFSPVDPTSAPVDPTFSPINPSSAPFDPTSTPINPTFSPINPTSAPFDPTSTPINPTFSPVDPTSAPVDPTSAPIIPTLTPIHPTSAPSQPEKTDSPTMIDSIQPTAKASTTTPETLIPAEPISVSLETVQNSVSAASVKVSTPKCVSLVFLRIVLFKSLLNLIL